MPDSFLDLPHHLGSFQDSAAFYTLTVYNADLEWPANAWNDRHVGQGFSWREGCVAFATLGSIGIEIEVWEAENFELQPQTQRAVRVPFTVNAGGEVGIDGSCFDDHRVSLTPGNYDLFYENGMLYNRGHSDEDMEFGLLDMWCRLTFIPNPDPQPEVLQPEVLRDEDAAGGEGHRLAPVYPLLMEADPA